MGVSGGRGLRPTEKQARIAVMIRILHVVLLGAVCLAVYSNGFGHGFNLDSIHLVPENPAIRQLANIPRFFADAGTFTSLRSNVDYRPILVVTHALNYAMGGQEMWWWHATQILLHASCVLGLYFLCARVSTQATSGITPPGSSHVAFAAALVFALHPSASGVVNYISARSSLLTAAFLLPSILAYMVPRESPRFAGRAGSRRFSSASPSSPRSRPSPRWPSIFSTTHGRRPAAGPSLAGFSPI